MKRIYCDVCGEQVEPVAAAQRVRIDVFVGSLGEPAVPVERVIEEVCPGCVKQLVKDAKKWGKAEETPSAPDKGAPEEPIQP